jgi:hypothetical protein
MEAQPVRFLAREHLGRDIQVQPRAGGGNGNGELLHMPIIAKDGEASLAFVGHAHASHPLDT